MKRPAFPPALFSLLLLAGCSSLPVATFESFRRSVDRARAGLEAESGREADWSREAEVQELADRKRPVLSDYMIRGTRGSGWSMEKPPAYWGVRRTGRALGEMNDAFAGYAALLVDALTGRATSDAEFDALAARINTGLRELAVLAAREDDKRAAGAASGLSEALRLFLRNRRLSELKAAIAGNQVWVDAYAARCASLTGLVRAGLKASYADQMASIQERWDDKRAPGRAGLSRSLFNLDEEYVDAMETLDALSRFYADLPAAHRELGEALGKVLKGPAALASLSESAARVARLTRELEKAK